METFLEQAAGSVPGLGSVGFVIMLIVIGLAALAVELFVIPGFGVAGIFGLLFLMGGSVAAWALFGPVWGGIVFAGVVITTILLTVFVFRSRAVRKRFVLDTQLEKGGGTASEDLTQLLGAIGEAKSDLRPAGIAMVDDIRVDVVSEGGFIQKGTKVKVMAVDGPRVIVAIAQ